MAAEHVHGPHCGQPHARPTRYEYYFEQGFLIGTCVLFGIIAIRMYYRTDSRGNTMLKWILVPEFWPWVLAGGIALLCLAVFALLPACVRLASRCQHLCCHEEEPGGHLDQDSVLWRMSTVAWPVLFFLVGLPNASISKEWLNDRVNVRPLGPVTDVNAKAGPILFSFDDVYSLAADASKRQEYEGRTVQVKGQMKKVSDKEFTLYNLKMTCCASDMIPLQARIIADSAIASIPDHSWIEVQGKLQFAKMPGKREGFIPVIRTTPNDVKPIAAE